MKNLDNVSQDLFNKIRGKFHNVTIGDQDGNITNEPSLARYFDFSFKTEGRDLGKVSVSVAEDEGVIVMYSNDLVTNENSMVKDQWYSFLKELRVFAKKRLLNFNTRNITKSNLNKRDYKFLATNRSGEDKMNESKLYGTSRVSYQDIDNARLVIKHTESVNAELATGRTQKIGSIFVDNAQGERFKYPYKHLAGARAMARHVAEGSNPHDDFGKHIVGLSEELAKLRKFKNYMGRSAVMAESLADYMDVVKERVATVKKTIESLQKKSFYSEAFESFEAPVLEEVPADVAENWIDELTIRQFNEELKDVFPYIYKLVSEATKARELGPLDLEGYSVYEGEDKKCSCCGDTPCSCDESCPECGGKGMYETVKSTAPEEAELESAFDKIMGQFAEGAGEYSYTLEYNGEENGYAKHKLTITSPEGKSKVVADDFTYFDTEDPEELQAELESWFHKGHGVGDEQAPEESAPYGEPSQQAQAKMDMEAAYEKGGEDALAKEMGLSPEELDQEINDCARENGLHPDDDRDECIGMVIDDTIDNADWDSYEGKKKDHDGDGDIDSDDYMKAKDIAIKKAMGKEKELKDEKTPIGEFILSHFDKETGEFPKGETAVLTMIEKDYGDKFIEPAKQFIERIYQTCEEFEMTQNPQQMETDTEFDRMRELAGLR